jgi:transcriptional regulator with XRE-family HTH domain
MSLMSLAARCGVTTSTLQELLRGRVNISVGTRLGVLTSSLQTFVDGGTSLGLASKLNMLSANLQELRGVIGRDGAIGLLIGLMASESD